MAERKASAGLPIKLEGKYVEGEDIVAIPIKQIRLFLQNIGREDFLPIRTGSEHRHMRFYCFYQFRMKGSLLKTPYNNVLTIKHVLYSRANPSITYRAYAKIRD